MGARTYPQCQTGAVQPSGNKGACAAQGLTGPSRAHPSLQADSRNVPLWNCLVQDFLLRHLWFLRWPHHRKPWTLCSAPQGFLHLGTLVSSSDTEIRWKGWNVSLARCVDGISLFCYLQNQLDRIASTANRLQSNHLLQWNILCAENREIWNEGF